MRRYSNGILGLSRLHDRFKTRLVLTKNRDNKNRCRFCILANATKLIILTYY